MKVLFISRPTLFSAPGGDTVQIQETAKELKKLGVEVSISLADENVNYAGFDLIHFFNIIRPNNISSHVKKSKLPFVISTIFVDYSEIEKEQRGFGFRILNKVFGPDGTDYLKTIARRIFNNERLIDTSYLWRGHKKSIEKLLNSADLLLPNSHNEFNRLKNRYCFENDYVKIPNAVADEFIHSSSTNDREGVICVGRIEFIKNQMNLIKAINETDIPLKIIGKPAPNHIDYYERCKKIANPNIEFLGQLNKEEVIKYMNQSKVHVLASWFETTGLSTIEAAACGCNIVITKKGDTEEYFKDHAFYCEPNDPSSIKKAIEFALKEEVNPGLKQYMKDNFTWDKTAKETLKAYQKVLT